MDEQTDNALANFVSLGMGLLLLSISIFSHTVPCRSLSYLRLALAPPAILCFWDFGFGSYEVPIRRLTPAVATASLYGIMRVIEHSIVSLWDPIPPRWVVRTLSTYETRVVIALPSTFFGRLSYTLDLLTSLRGSSLLSELEWDWIPHSLQASISTLSRAQFIAHSIRTFLIQYIFFDLCDTLNKSQNWESGSHNRPVSSLPVAQQLIFSISVCAGIVLSISMPYKLISCIFVICGSSPGSWPPMFDSPFYAISLREFWNRRWHFMFRRNFERLTYPLLHHVSKGAVGRGTPPIERTIFLLRSTLVFACSTLLHLFIMHRLALRGCRGGDPCYPFLDVSILKFFLSQPVGLLVESLYVVPFAESVFPTYPCRASQKLNGYVRAPSRCDIDSRDTKAVRPPDRWERDIVTRMYAWSFLIWTGRWWSDQWVRSGLLDEPLIPVSIVRGVLRGQWMVPKNHKVL